MKPSRRLDLTVQYASAGAEVPARPAVRRWARAALTGGGSVTVRFVDREEGAELNSNFRGKTGPTNVLSFPYEHDGRVLGDLVLCVPVILAEAREQGKPAESHFAHMVVHGMLHLQGFDHENEAQAEVMEGRERAILGLLGFADPYADV